MYPWSHNTFITDILWQNRISSRLVNFRGTEIDDVCTNTQTVLPIILPHYIFTRTHTHARTHAHTVASFAFHGIHNHNANQIPPATFSPLHTKFPAIKISRKSTMFYFFSTRCITSRLSNSPSHPHLRETHIWFTKPHVNADIWLMIWRTELHMHMWQRNNKVSFPNSKAVKLPIQ